ncbi:MAG: hypothetical protein AB7V58_12575 [Solirubrobacterales bacterium]
MRELPLVKLSGDVEGDYVVLRHHAGGVLRIAPERPEGRPKVAALKKTCTACPSQWEGTLEDGRVIYARYRWGELSVGVGGEIDEAVHNGWTDEALYADQVGEGLDGFMVFEELKAHLYGLLEFPPDLTVENEREPSWDPGQLAKLLAPPRKD